MSIPQNVVNDWLKSKEIIEKFIIELVPNQSPEYYDHNSSALIARLAHAGMSIDSVGKK